MIASPLDAVARVEVEHDVQRHAGVAAKHLYERRPLARRDGGERIGEELPASQMAGLTVRGTAHPRRALPVKPGELGRVCLPATFAPGDIVERGADLLAHHVVRG